MHSKSSFLIPEHIPIVDSAHIREQTREWILSHRVSLFTRLTRWISHFLRNSYET